MSSRSIMLLHLKFQRRECTEGFCWGLRHGAPARIGGSWRGGQGPLVCRVGNGEEKEERAREANGRAAETSFVLWHQGHSALALRIENLLFSLSPVTFTQPDQAKKRVSGVRGSHVMKGQSRFYSSHVILQWVGFLSFSHHP